MSDTVSYRIVILFLLVCMILFAVYIVGWFRNLALGRDESSLNSLAEIERLKAEGKIDFAEYQRLKKTAAQSMSAALLSSTKTKSTLSLNQAKLASGTTTGQGRNRPAGLQSAESEKSTAPIDFTEVDSPVDE